MQALTEKSIEYLSEVPIEAKNGKIYRADLLIGKNLVVEVDGPSHGAKLEKDRIRDEQLALLGLKTLRFTDRQVRTELASVIVTIQKEIALAKIEEAGEVLQLIRHTFGP
jgi:very-short-patch-repair endonuclease